MAQSATPQFSPPPTVPRCWAEQEWVLRTEAVLTTTHVGITPIDVSEARWLTLFVNIDGADTSGTVQMILACSNKEGATAGQPPLNTDDSWYPPVIVNDTTSDIDPAGTKMTNSDWTFQPEWQRLIVRPGHLQFEAVEASTDEIRVAIPVWVGPYRWFYFSANASGAGTLPSLSVTCARAL